MEGEVMTPIYLAFVAFGGGILMSYGVAWGKERAVDIGAVVVVGGTLGALVTGYISAMPLFS
jgi:hypothetical protein